jgi:hypothetical protein
MERVFRSSLQEMWILLGDCLTCEELVGGFTGDDVIDIERNIFI